MPLHQLIYLLVYFFFFSVFLIQFLKSTFYFTSLTWEDIIFARMNRNPNRILSTLQKRKEKNIYTQISQNFSCNYHFSCVMRARAHTTSNALASYSFEERNNSHENGKRFARFNSHSLKIKLSHEWITTQITAIIFVICFLHSPKLEFSSIFFFSVPENS